jgi:hypothetical protein
LCFAARDAIKPGVKAFYVFPFRPILLLLVLALTACAGAPRPESPAPPVEPAAPPPPAEPVAPPIPPIRTSQQICGVQAGHTIDLAELSLPEGSRPLGLALAADTVWLLFEPALLVGVPRETEAPAPVAIPEFGAVEEMADLISGPAGAAWSALAVDRFDGTVWLVSETVPGLWRKRPGRRPEAVRLQSAPALRRGGFRDVLAGRGSVWLAPACADSAVWRLAPSGKLLGTALDGAAGECPAAVLERDWAGTAWALRPESGELFRMGFDLGWQPAGADLASPAPAPAGSESVRSWFFWGAEPFGLTGDGAGGGPLLVRRAASGVEVFREDCGAGNALVDVAGDERGWVVLTRQWLRLADHERATGIQE